MVAHGTGCSGAGCGCLDHHDCGQIADKAASPGNLIQEVPLHQNIQDLQHWYHANFPQVREIIDLQLRERGCQHQPALASTSIMITLGSQSKLKIPKSEWTL